jgi:hypothetical protein
VGGDKLAKQADRFREPGESVVAAARCLPLGSAKRRAAGGLLFGVLGVLAAGSTAQSGPAVFGQALPTNLAVAVTNRRLLVFRLSEVTGKVAELTHSVPFAQVVDVRFEIGRSVGMKAVYLTISFADGSTASLEVVRPNTKDGESVARALSATVRPTRSNG